MTLRAPLAIFSSNQRIDVVLESWRLVWLASDIMEGRVVFCAYGVHIKMMEAQCPPYN